MNPSPDDLLRFYRGEGRDHAGRSFDEVLAMDLDALESTHDYIQWIFPLATRSAFVPGAPVLDTATIEAMRADPLVPVNALRALRRMLEFYGMTLDDANPARVRIDVSARFSARSRVWLAPGNHNLRRITRILTSLRLMGLAPYAQALFERLSALHREHGACIGATTFGYWRDAIR